MKNWLIRYEASDFDNTVFDSSQLSAIRGASLSFLYSSRLVERLIDAQFRDAARTIYAGASQGAFCFEATEEQAKRIKADIARALKQPDSETGCHQHLAYVVALVEGSDLPALSRAEALCNAMAAQTAQPAWPVFSEAQTKPGSRRDPRPAQPGKDKTMSAAIEDRAAFGRLQRKDFYWKFHGSAGTDPGFDFSDQFEDITFGAEALFTVPADGGTPVSLPLSLHNKMAVFYADGNSFGKHRDRAIALDADLGGLTHFSAELVKRQQQLLTAITDWLKAHHRPGQDNAWFSVDPRDNIARARFETLLWGGDEMLFVLPCWLAIEFADLFFSTVRDWRIGGQALTFSAGIVICDRKTPISQAKVLADKLASAAKSVSRGAADYGMNSLQIEIFEGLSLPDGDLDAFRDQLYFNGLPEAGREAYDARVADTNMQLTLTGSDVAAFAERIVSLQARLPRSQVYKLLAIGAREATAYKRTATEVNDNDERTVRTDYKLLEDAFDTYVSRAGADSGLKRRELSVLSPCDGKPASLVLNIAMLARLWDYAARLSPTETAATDSMSEPA